MTVEMDVPGTVSENLATVIESELNNPEYEQAPRLGNVLNAINHGLVQRLVDDKRLDIQKTDDTIIREIKGLIETYGADRPAQDFIRYRSSENLATVIEAVLDKYDGDQPPTLGIVLDNMNHGLVAELVGTGEIDADEDDTLFSEIQRLIRSHGENTPAEQLLP